MNLNLMLLIIASVSMSALAQLCLKVGVSRTSTLNDGPVVILFHYLTNAFVFGGLALYGLGTLLWLFVLSKLPLTAAYPFVGLGFILTMLIGAFILGEQVTITRFSGTILIAIGCILVARSAA